MEAEEGKVDEKFLAWLAGFMDGEGSFIVSICKSRSSKACRYGLLVKVCVELTQSEPNAWVLDFIKEKLGLGGAHIKIVPSERGFNDNSNRKPTRRLSFNGASQCMKIAEMLLPYLVLKKKQCELLLEACKIIKEKRTWTKEDLIRIAELRDQITDCGRRRHDSRYLTADDVKRILSSYPDYGKKKSKWSVEEDRFLVENYGRMPVEEIAKVLGRSVSSVQHRASRLGELMKRRVFRCVVCGYEWYPKRAFSPKCPACGSRKWSGQLLYRAVSVKTRKGYCKRVYKLRGEG
jgi:rubrerythrin